jgi:hypothetical protein
MERYAKSLTQIREEQTDQVELCKRFIMTDRLPTTKNQISPFTKTKVKKGTDEYLKTLENCDYIMKKEYFEKTKSSKVSNKMESILSLVGSSMNQNQRRSLFTAIPVSGVAEKTKKNLEIERNRELLKLPLFQKYNSPYPDGIAFRKMETETLPSESYPIFLKYMKKGVPIPKEIEDLFDNPPDPKFYSKLLRIAIEQKIKLGEHLLSIIFSHITYDKVDIDQIVQYYKNVLQRPISEFGLGGYNIKNPSAILEYQTIKSLVLFIRLIMGLKKIPPKLLKNLLQRYSGDTSKLLVIYYKLLELKKETQALQIEKTIEESLNLKTLETIIELLYTKYKDQSSRDLLGPLYIKSMSKVPTEDINLNVLKMIIEDINDFDLKIDLLKLLHKLDDEIDVRLFADIYAKMKNSSNEKKFEVLKYFFEKIDDERDLDAFFMSLHFDHGLDESEWIDVLMSHVDEIPYMVRQFLRLEEQQ